MSYQKTGGSWKPLVGSRPFAGEVDQLCTSEEAKLEVRCSFDKVEEAIVVIKRLHPYEEPLINVIPLCNELFHCA